MANVRYRLWGLSGSRKTCTALTGRGRQAVIDRDNQMWMYVNNPRMAGLFSPFATMAEDFDQPGPDGRPLVKGSPAVWLATDPTVTTRDRVAEFVRKAGLGRGDQLTDDPFSALWELCVDAADIAFGKKGMKVDYYGLKHPTTTLMNLYKRLACDVAFTAHQKAEWSKEKNAPSDKVIPTGEGQRTPRDIMWEFRMDVGDDGTCRMTVTKEKGMLFKVGETFTNPNISRIFTERGVYDMADGMVETETEELDETTAEAVFETASPAATAFDLFKQRMRQAAADKKLSAFRDDPANKRLAGTFTPKQLAEVKALVEELAK